MKATSELGKILEIRYIHGIIAYLRRRREIMVIFLKRLFLIAMEVEYRCDVRTVRFPSPCVIYAIVSYRKDPLWSLQRPCKVKGKCLGGLGFPLDFTTIISVTWSLFAFQAFCSNNVHLSNGNWKIPGI